MAKNKKQEETALIAVEPMEVEVLPPQAGAVGEFLADTSNMFRARGMRMKALFGRINETGQQMEKMLRFAARHHGSGTWEARRRFAKAGTPL